MFIHKAYRFRIYPTKQQTELIKKTMGCSRFVFNHFLALWNDSYKETGKGLTYHSCSSKLPTLKNEYEWLKEAVNFSYPFMLKQKCNRWIKPKQLLA